MLRKIIKIDESKCNGCGICAEACHEDAISIKDGKAVLMRDDYCDGLGDCLPSCPTNAISFETREAAAYDEKAVQANMQAKSAEQQMPLTGGCPGSKMQQFNKQKNATQSAPENTYASAGSQLQQWPVQIKLVPVNAPYFDNAKLLVAADCSAFAFANFHEKFIKDHITLIGCPKLDEVDYTDKLTQIIATNNIKSVHVVRMEVPCCGGIENAVKNALVNSQKMIPWQVSVVSVEGYLIEE